jgi:hypothetical protein
MEAAEHLTRREQTGSHRRGPRQHRVLESRNFICAHIKRHDAVSRRFIQYVAMRTSSLVILVRDVETGNVIVQPPKEQLWLLREKMGRGRASRNLWTNLREVGPAFFEELDRRRKWSVGFKGYYDVIIWDLLPGEQFPRLYNLVQSMLMKAHRFQSGRDVFKPVEHILRSLYYDEATNRVKDIPTSAKAATPSVWDRLCDVEVKVFKGGHISDDAPPEWKYTDADRLEDLVLFPWERTDSTEVAPAPEQDLAMNGNKGKAFTSSGPNLERFVFDLDTDEELGDSEDDKHGVESSCNATISGEDRMLFAALEKDEPAEIRDIVAVFNDWNMTAMSRPKPGLMLAALKGLIREAGEPELTTKEEWAIFMDSERASSFKKIWHAADLEPGAVDRWNRYRRLAKGLEDWVPEHPKQAMHYFLRDMKAVLQMLTRLGHGRDDTRFREIRDMRRAQALVSLFTDPDLDFFNSKEGMSFKGIPLLIQQARADAVPDTRTPHSNKMRPKTHWREWDAIPVEHTADGILLPDTPKHWGITLQPKIAHLYKEGVLSPSYDEASSGPAVCITEPGREGKPDLYFDWRHLLDDVDMPPTLQDPTRVAPLLEQAQEYASKVGPRATFSVLRVWSAPHFWPLMLGHDNRRNTSFTDGCERTWEWLFIPKDMPYSEWSIHKTVRMRLEPYGSYFKQNVVHKRDMVLIMARDPGDCRDLTAAAVWALETRPWRVEVDPWKSWWNVDVAFLQGLDDAWWT